MKTQTHHFVADGETLAGIELQPLHPAANTAPFLFLHGAGKATKERALPLASKLASDHGIRSFLFDFSGHGASSGTLSSSSLRKRVVEARAALKESGFREPISLCAFSMGGHVALELLRYVHVRSLALFYPAVYARDATHLQFDSAFSAAIRRPDSWRDNDVLPLLGPFAGDVLLVRGSADEVVPSAVGEAILTAAPHARKSNVTLPGAPHLIMPIIYEDQQLFDKIASTMAAGAEITNARGIA